MANLEINLEEQESKVIINASDVANEKAVEIDLNSLKGESYAVISMDYLRQMMLILVQVRGFMERSEAGALSAEQSKLEAEELVRQINLVKIEVENSLESCEEILRNINDIKIDFDVKYRQIVYEYYVDIAQIKTDLILLSEQCKTYADSAQASQALANEILTQVALIKTDVSAMSQEVLTYRNEINHIALLVKGYTDSANSAAERSQDYASSAKESADSADSALISAMGFANEAKTQADLAKGYADVFDTKQDKLTETQLSNININHDKYLEVAREVTNEEILAIFNS